MILQFSIKNINNNWTGPDARTTMSRKFSDSEIRAYTRNRHEEKVLRSKLERLREDISTFHDTSSKQRQELFNECKGIRMTTGGSPVPGTVRLDQEFDISKRVQRPWAYSVMETTYNAVYKDAVIPLPKQKRQRPKSEYFNRENTPRSIRSSFENKSITDTVSSPRVNNTNALFSVSSVSDSATKRSELRTPGSKSLSGRQRLKGDHHTIVSTSDNDKHLALDKSKSVPEIVIGPVVSPGHNDDELLELKLSHAVSENTSSLEDGEAPVFLEDEGNPNESARSFAPIFLPPVYKITSQAYQDAERERTIQRSKSRVSFSSNPTPVKDAPNAGVTKEKPRPVSPEVPSHITTELTEHNRTHVSDTGTDILKSSFNTERSFTERGNAVVTLDPESFHDIRIRKLEDVVYKGRRLKNYIHPEDRYKIDPIIMKRRQNKMDKLAKESVSFLKRVNHENIKVEIAFPRSARKRILLKLVEENNSVKGKRVCDTDGPLIQRKVEYFMSSISDYIRQQQYEREQTYM